MKEQRPLILALVFVMLFETSWQVSNPVLALHLKSLGASPKDLGLTLSAAAVVPLLLAMPTGGLADRIGPGRLSLLGTALMLVGYAAFAMAPNLLVAAACLSAVKVAFTATIVSSQLFVASFGGDQGREQRLGWMGAASAAAQVIAPPIGGLVAEQFGLYAAFVGSAAAAALAGAVALGIPRERMVRGHQGVGVLRGLKLLSILDMRFALACAILTLPVFDGRSSFQPVFLDGKGMSPGQISILFAINGLAAILSRFALAPLVARFGHYRLIAGAFALAGVALALIPALPMFWTQAVLVSLLGVAMGFSQPLTIARAATAAPAGERGLALGLRMTVNRLGGVVSPLLLGLIAGAAGLPAVFLATAASAFGGVLIATWAYRRIRT